jgi:hypothetical protein
MIRGMKTSKVGILFENLFLMELDFVQLIRARPDDRSDGNSREFHSLPAIAGDSRELRISVEETGFHGF